MQALILLSIFLAICAAEQNGVFSIAASYGDHWLQHTEAGVGKCLAGPVAPVKPLSLPENLSTEAELTCRREDFTLAYQKTSRSRRTTISAETSSGGIELPCAATTIQYTDNNLNEWLNITVKFNDCGVIMTASPHLLTYVHRIKIVDYIEGRNPSIEHPQVFYIDIHCDLVPQTNWTVVVPSCPEPEETLQPLPCEECKFEIENYSEAANTYESISGNIEWSIHPAEGCNAGFYVDRCEIRNIFSNEYITTAFYAPVQAGTHDPRDSVINKVYHSDGSGRYGYAISVGSWTAQEAIEHPLYQIYKLGHNIQCTVALCKNDPNDEGNAPLCNKFHKTANMNARMSANARSKRFTNINSGKVVVA